MRLLFEIWNINWIDDREAKSSEYKNEWINFSLAINVTAQNAG